MNGSAPSRDITTHASATTTKPSFAKKVVSFGFKSSIPPPTAAVIAAEARIAKRSVPPLHTETTAGRSISAAIISKILPSIFKTRRKFIYITPRCNHAYFRKPVSHAAKNLRLFTEGSPSIHPSDR